MLEIGGGGDLLHEPLGAEHGGEFGQEDLDGDVAVVLDVVGVPAETIDIVAASVYLNDQGVVRLGGGRVYAGDNWSARAGGAAGAGPVRLSVFSLGRLSCHSP